MYSIKVLNNTEQNGNFCLYQKGQNPQETSLAWLIERAVPHGGASFIWNLNYSFVQAETGIITPGVVFRPAQVVPANLDSQNNMTLTEQDGRPMLTDLRSEIPNMLTILPDQTIQPNRVAAGIGVNGSPILVTQAIPNITLAFQPQTRYRLAFGNFTKGEVLDTQRIVNYVEIDFTPGIYNYNATYNPNGTWTVQPT